MIDLDNVSALCVAARNAGTIGLAVRVEMGRGQLVSVRYDKKGRSTVTPLSQFVDGAGLCKAVRVQAARQVVIQGARSQQSCPECERSNGPHYRGPCEH